MSGNRTTSVPNIVVAVPPSVSTQNFLWASMLVTFRWKCPTTAGADVLLVWAVAPGTGANVSTVAVPTAHTALLTIPMRWLLQIDTAARPAHQILPHHTLP